MIIWSQNFFSNEYFYDLLEIKKNEIVKWACRKLTKFCEAGFYCGWFRYDHYTIIPIKGISDPLNYQFLFDHINPIQNGKIYVRGGLDHKTMQFLLVHSTFRHRNDQYNLCTDRGFQSLRWPPKNRDRSI